MPEHLLNILWLELHALFGRKRGSEFMTVNADICDSRALGKVLDYPQQVCVGR